jgi:hypothetical protein
MTSVTNTSRARAHDSETPAAVPHADADVLTVDAAAVPVGTFAAGQSAEGRHVAVTTAPQGSFAEGQAEEDQPDSPEAAHAAQPAPSPRAH